MTLIEKALFLDSTVHDVSSLALSAEAVDVVIHRSAKPAETARAHFVRPVLRSVDGSYAHDGLDFPWHIIGFDSDPLPDGRWKFCLHTAAIELVFESDWPVIEKRA